MEAVEPAAKNMRPSVGVSAPTPAQSIVKVTPPTFDTELGETAIADVDSSVVSDEGSGGVNVKLDRAFTWICVFAGAEYWFRSPPSTAKEQLTLCDEAGAV